MSEVLSILFECLDLWVIPIFRQEELPLSSIQKSVDSVFQHIGVAGGPAGPAVAGPINFV